MARRTGGRSGALVLRQRHPAPASSSATPPIPPPAIETVEEPTGIAALVADTPLIPFNPKRRVPEKPFPFLLLPSEIRIKVYEYFFEDAVCPDTVLDLGPDNYKRFHGKLRLMRVCKQIHDEATHLLYSNTTFRLFPTYPGRYFKSKHPILSRLKPNQRECITSLELRLGPGWNAPPRGWVVNDALGLADCTNVHKLKVFVECDPSDGIFKGFRRSEGFYEKFCRALLGKVIEGMPALQIIEFDAWSSVNKSGAMMHALLDVAAQYDRVIQWGPERGWDDPDLGAAASAPPSQGWMEGLGRLSISGLPRTTTAWA
jgi:hypothetical protein